MFIQEAKLEYLISEKSGFVVVRFTGSMTKLTAGIMEQCRDEVVAKTPQFVVLSFDGATQVEPGIVPALVKLQKALRDLGAQVKVCSLKSEFERYLIDAAAIRQNELAIDLRQALTSWTAAAKAA